jgi:hypothetical protein
MAQGIIFVQNSAYFLAVWQAERNGIKTVQRATGAKDPNRRYRRRESSPTFQR